MAALWVAIKLYNSLRVGDRSFWVSGRPLGPRKPFQKVGGGGGAKLPTQRNGLRGPRVCLDPKNGRFPILKKLRSTPPQSAATISRRRGRRTQVSLLLNSAHHTVRLSAGASSVSFPPAATPNYSDSVQPNASQDEKGPAERHSESALLCGCVQGQVFAEQGEVRFEQCAQDRVILAVELVENLSRKLSPA